MRIKGRESSQRGAAVLEAALTMLTLLMLLMAIFEAARLINIQHTLTNAAREGARLSVLPLQGGTDTLAPEALVRSRVRSFLDASGMNGASVPDGNIVVSQACCYDTVTDSCVTCASPSTIRYSRVTVTVPYKLLSISMFKFMEVNIRGQALMRNETNLQ